MYKSLLALCLFGTTLVAQGQLWTGVVDSSRAINWANAGSPAVAASASWTQCGTTISAGASAATVNSAIAGCSANTYLLLGPGTFNFNTGIRLKSSVELRGSGSNQTFTVFTAPDSCLGTSGNYCLPSADANYYGGPSNLANWTAGYAKGTTSITLSSNTNLAVGSPVTLDQTDDAYASDTGYVFVCYTPQNSCSTNGDNGGFLRSGRSQEQIVTVTSISGSGPYTIGITPGIYMPNWSSGKSPQAWWPTSPMKNAGVTHLSVDGTNSSGIANFMIFNCVDCFISDVRSIQPQRSHVFVWQSPHTQIQNNYFYRTANQTSSSYGVELDNASDTLMVNNVFQQNSGPYPENGDCSGCVLAYNYTTNNIFDSGGGVFNYQQQDFYPHVAGVNNILAEGNQGAGMYSDNFHGTHNFITLFRNNFNGFQPNNGNPTTGGQGALLINSFSRMYNIIGNVLGDSNSGGHFSHYRDDITSGFPNGTSVVTVGLGDAVPNDPNVALTLMMWGNYNTVENGIRWCGPGAPGFSSAPCSSTSEVPSTTSSFANPVPSSLTLPNSFFYSSKPGWWPTGEAWPPIGPDVTTGTIANLAGHAYPIPAANCATNMGIPADGTGSVQAFDSTACYTTTPPPTPGAPTGVNVIFLSTNAEAPVSWTMGKE